MSSTTSVKPAHVVHRGVVQAAGVVVEPSVVGTPEARRRVLRLWAPGAAVFQLEEGLFVRFGQPRWLRCRDAAGLVVVGSQGILLGLPLERREVERLMLPAGALVRLRGGVFCIEALSSARLEDPARWLEVDHFAIVDAIGLASPPEPPRVTMPDAPPFDARLRLSGVPAAAPERDEILRALGAPTRRPSPVRAGAGWLAVRIAAGFQAVLRTATRWRASQSPGGGAGASARTAAGPSRELQLPGPLRWLVSKLMLLSQLGRRQARYLSRLIDMLERGDVDAALRHAIPIGGPAAERLRSLFQMPSPRQVLVVRPAALPAGSVIGIGSELLAELERLYRAAFQRLDAQGRIDEAAFVLAELLHANHEAVAFLERHGRLRLAAELAEARDLPAALVVRQWFVAGDRARAVEIARRRGAFAGAVAQLERSRRLEEATALRLLWADALASEGDLSRAIAVIWKVPQARPQALGWIERGIEQGGPVGSAMLVKKLTADPGAFESVSERALPILEDDNADGLATRAALADALANTKATPEIATLARPAIRALVRDEALFEAPSKPNRLRKLIALASDGALRTDMPSLPNSRHVPLRHSAQPVAIAIDAGDVGTVPILDAAYLENGRVVVALGETGVSLRSREGKELSLFNVPAHHLVLSDAGDKAIAVARRGSVCRLARLDLVGRTAQDWCDAPVDAFASDYDGSRWFVATRDLHAIDVASARFDGPWAVPRIVENDGRAVRIARSRTGCAVFVPGGPAQLWSYELPSLTLRGRRDLSPLADDAEPAEHREVSPAGLVVEHACGRSAEAGDAGGSPFLRWCRPDGHWSQTAIGRPGERPGPLAVAEDFVAATLRGPDGCRVALLDTAAGRLRAVVSLGQAQELALRLSRSTLTIADDRGRLLVLDLDQGWLLRDLRL